MTEVTMKCVISFLFTMICFGCSQDADVNGIVYSGNANLNIRLHQFTAINADNEKDVILTMTGPRELTFNFNNKIAHINYDEDVIVIRSQTDNSEWTARKVKAGFELGDGTLLQYGDCRDWIICLLDSDTKLPILKGKYSLAGSNVKLTLWISDGEKHVELLALMANGLFNRSKNRKESIESSLGTLSSQVWAY